MFLDNNGALSLYQALDTQVKLVSWIFIGFCAVCDGIRVFLLVGPNWLSENMCNTYEQLKLDISLDHVYVWCALINVCVTNSFLRFRGDGADALQVLEKKPKRHKRVIRITSKKIRFRAEIFECELVLASSSPGALYAKTTYCAYQTESRSSDGAKINRWRQDSPLSSNDEGRHCDEHEW